MRPRDERDEAMGALSDLLQFARAHAAEFRRFAERFRLREEQRRLYMSLSIPALSKSAMARLVEVEAVRRQGGDDAYKTAFKYAVEDRRAGSGDQSRERRIDDAVWLACLY